MDTISVSILADISIFAAVIKNGGFSHAAKHLGLSNGLISRRISSLELELGVTLIKRTTRQFQLTPEGQLLWQHALRIQQELDSAINLIHSSADKPEGTIRMSAPLYLGRHYFMPMILKFMHKFSDIKVELDLSNQKRDPIKEKFDLVIRGAGFRNQESLSDSSLKMKLLIRDHIGIYASKSYLQKYGEPKSVDELSRHIIVSYYGDSTLLEEEKLKYRHKNKTGEITLFPHFRCSDIECSHMACISGYGIGKFTGLVAKNAVQKKQLFPILQQYHWGKHNLYIVYSSQQSLPKRTRLLLDFIVAEMQYLK